MVCRTVAATRTTALARAVAATRTAASYRIPCDLGGSADYYRAMDSTDNLGTDATFTRASTQRVYDYLSVLQTCEIDEAGITGGRRISENNWSELDASGDPINPNILKGRFSEAGGTNSLLQCREFDTAPWAVQGTPVLTKDQTGIDGVANTAWTIADDDAAGFEGLSQAITIPNDSNTHVAVFRIKKDSDVSRFPELELRLLNGITKTFYLHFNTATGEIVHTNVVGTVSSKVELVGDFWVIAMTIANDTSGNTALRVDIFPAIGDVFGVRNTATTGSIVADWAQVELNKSSASSPILTTTAAASRAATLLTYPNPFQQNDMCGYIEFTPSSGTPQPDEYVWGCDADGAATDFLAIRYNSGQFKFAKKLANTFVEAITPVTYVKGKTYKVSWRISTDGMKLWVDAVSAENTTADAKTGVSLGSGILNLGGIRSAGQGHSNTKELMVWYKVQPDEFLQAIAAR